MKKPFVSLSFANTERLQILKLNKSKSKVEVFHTIDLPKKLISNYEVKDTDVMSSIIKEAWKFLKVNERSVGIVIPEFSTFIKLLTIPDLSLEELDEAIRWQAKEYLPERLEKMVLDWKLIQKDGTGNQVLIVAIEKRVLSSYVQSVSKAGLIPIVVETPSLSLARASESESGGLIIYKGFDDVVLVVTRGEKIYGSSVGKSENFDEVIDLGKKMMNHYKDAQVSRILVSGFEDNTEYIKKLSSTTDKKVGEVSLNINGMDREQVQNYLVPIQLQMKDPAEPANLNTINLLPKELVKTYFKEKLRIQVWSLTLTVSLFIWAAFFAAVSAYFIMTQQLKSESVYTPSQQRFVQETQDALARIEEINGLAQKVKLLGSLTVPPEEVLNKINSAKPGPVSINAYNVDFNTGKVTLSGIAQDRQSLIDFKENLEGNPDFSRVAIPLSSLEVESNLEYKIGFTYVPLEELSDTASRKLPTGSETLQITN